MDENKEMQNQQEPEETTTEVVKKGHPVLKKILKGAGLVFLGAVGAGAAALGISKKYCEADASDNESEEIVEDVVEEPEE